MEPNQVNVVHSRTHQTLVVILVLLSIASVSYLSFELMRTNKKFASQTAEMEALKNKPIEQLSLDQRSSSYTISTVKDVSKGKFEMKVFPSVTFAVSKISRVEGLKMAGCVTDFPEEVQKNINLAGCYTYKKDDPEISNKSLVGFDIEVSNNSQKYVTGDIIKVIYYETREDQTVARIASLGAIPFSSYSIQPLSDRKVSLATWIPNNITKIELIYGMDDFTAYNSKLANIENADGRLVIDFEKSAIVEKKIFSAVTENKETIPTASITDNKVKSILAKLRANAEVYYGIGNNYGSATYSCTEGMFNDDSIAADIKDLIGLNIIKCNSTGSAYAVSSKLPQSKGYWCVDSSGMNTPVSSNLNPGDVNC